MTFHSLYNHYQDDEQYEDALAQTDMGIILPQPSIIVRIRTFLPATMSTTELKTILHERIETLDEDSLALADRLLAELKLEKLRAQLNEGFEADFQAGKLTTQKVQAAIKAARAARPYR